MCDFFEVYLTFSTIICNFTSETGELFKDYLRVGRAGFLVGERG